MINTFVAPFEIKKKIINQFNVLIIIIIIIIFNMEANNGIKMLMFVKNIHANVYKIIKLLFMLSIK